MSWQIEGGTRNVSIFPAKNDELHSFVTIRVISKVAQAAEAESLF